MSALELDQRVAQQLLEGRESIIPKLGEQDIATRSSIAAKDCPHCGEKLRPRIPSDPSKVFQGLSIAYEGVCPTHGVIAG